MPRVARSADTREAGARRKPYQPPSKLAAPTPPPGVRTRWIRVKSGDEDDVENVSNREYEGYVPVSAEEAAQWEGKPKWHGTSHASGPYQGMVGRKDLVLMKNAEDNVIARQVYYEEEARKQMVAIDQDMYREARGSPNYLAFEKPKRRTHSTKGTNRPQFADDDE